MKIQVLVWLIGIFAIVVSAAHQIHVGGIARHTVGFAVIERHDHGAALPGAPFAAHERAHI